MSTTPPVDALARLDQCIEEVHESLMALQDALMDLLACTETDELFGKRLPPETEHIVLAEQRRCLLAAALIRRLERRVRPYLVRLCEQPTAPLVSAEPVQR
jgi:hypothetical protein